jgi:hypothetical protein
MPASPGDPSIIFLRYHMAYYYFPPRIILADSLSEARDEYRTLVDDILDNAEECTERFAEKYPVAESVAVDLVDLCDQMNEIIAKA